MWGEICKIGKSNKMKSANMLNTYIEETISRIAQKQKHITSFD